MGKGKKLSVISILHYFRFTYRSILFLVYGVAYLYYRIHQRELFGADLKEQTVLSVIIWAVFVVEMLFRSFPSKFESPGCQKQFRRNYIKTGKTDIQISDNNATVLCLIVWIVPNLAFGALHMIGIFDDGIMLLLCLAYSICDMICILFFCPFQSFFLKNKCCISCRIYNWDYAMLFTPLFFVGGIYSWSLLALAIALLLRWEIAFYKHPERFSENTNAYLECRNCTEKLCAHKTQLKSLRKHVEKYTAEKLNRLKK